MNPVDIITKKKENKELNRDEIEYMVNGYINGDVENYQMSALLMAININGMTFDETYNLTDVMLNSGDHFDFSDVKEPIVDKHYTGGIGD